MFACLVVVLFYSPQSETLLKVSSATFNIFFFLWSFFTNFGEVIGLFDNGHRSLIWKKLLLSFMGAALASFS